MRHTISLLALFVAACVVSAPGVSWAQTGKIAGQVVDAASGEPLPGVNVIVVDEMQGATTNAEGYYTILNVSPGTYSLRASFVGYARETVVGVQVNIDLTTTINFELQEEAVGLQEVTVQATEPVVKPDISANVANIDAQQFENLPVAGVEEVLNLQAGIEPGLNVRGGGQDELAFVVDGMSMRTGRRNQPFTGVSFTSVQEIQVQTGGFNAEYGNVRAGLINVVTKDAPRDRYTVDALVRYQPAQAKNFGGLPEDEDSFFMRPFLPDPNVADDRDPAFVGTDPANSAWDKYTERQYPDFVGWENVASNLANDEDPNNNLTPAQLVELFRWRTRKDNEITDPDYTVDLTIGGPLVPGLSDQLGDLRFLASYREQQRAYLYPLQRRTYNERTGQFNLTTNFSPAMKLTLHGMIADQVGMNDNQGRGDVAIMDGRLPAYPWANMASAMTPNAERARVVFSPHAVNPVTVEHAMFGASFTHTLNQNTFYEARIQRMYSGYESTLPRARDLTGEAYCISADSDQNVNQFCFNEAPYGFAGQGGNILGAGFTTGGHWAKTRDTSDVAVWSGQFDVTSQLNRFSQLKAGFDVFFSKYDIRWERVNLALGNFLNRNVWQRDPLQGAAYVQNKLEFQGMVANLGFRLDYMDANANWWSYGFYDEGLSSLPHQMDEVFEKEATDPQFALSPRLGVSFPMTTDSKIYFNYGHFRNMLDPTAFFSIQSAKQGGISNIGNPRHPMPKTVAYELGYDQNLFDQFLLRISGYYRDVRKQPRTVNFDDIDGSVQYSTFYPWNYEDIRGAEVTLSKTTGTWVRGFANYTFMVTKSGNFGFQEFHENAFEQREYLRTSQDYTIFNPVAQPYARFNLELRTPPEFGPAAADWHPLARWRLNFLGSWRQGETWTWTGGGGGSLPGLQNNVAWRDYYNFDFRVTRQFSLGSLQMQAFADVTNVFNLRHIHDDTAFLGTRDFFYYMRSLHLPESAFEDVAEEPYVWVYGDDQPGDKRDPGVAFQPVEVFQNLDRVPEGYADESQRAYFYSKEDEDYYQWDPSSSSWSEVDDGEIDRMLETKAYIDMPNSTFSTFLNPRQVLFGLRVSF